jgi:hypothetical protein
MFKGVILVATAFTLMPFGSVLRVLVRVILASRRLRFNGTMPDVNPA